MNNLQCLSTIGIKGDRTCAKLSEYHHCRHCPDFIDRARSFFDRPASSEYIHEWNDRLSSVITDEQKQTESHLVFRLGSEWFAIPVTVVREVAVDSPVHSIPLRSGPIFLGLINIRGELHLCASLHNMLKLEETRGGPEAHGKQRHVVIIERQEKSWAFKADEIKGIIRCDRTMEKNSPVNVGSESAACTSSVIQVGDLTVARLNESLVFSNLERSVS